nr:quinone oxidoreductase-like protein 2 homolog [Tanacetum cinerariifolium]
MEALVCRSLGDPTIPPDSTPTTALTVTKTHPIPKLTSPSSVLVKIKSTSLNYANYLQVLGKYQEKFALPFVPGSDYSGVVVSVGDKVAKFKVGDSVCSFAGMGSFAQFIVADEKDLSANNVSRFRVEYWADYDNDEDPILFRRRVFPSSLDGEHIIGKIVETLIDSKLFDRLHDDDAVSLCCVGILQLVFSSVEGRRIVPAWILRLANDRVGWDKRPMKLKESVSWVWGTGTWSVGRDVWKGSGETNNSFLNMGTPTNWQTPMPSQLGSSNWQSQMAAQSATLFMQPAIPLHVGTYNWQSHIPSHMGNPNSQTPIETHPDAAGLLDQNIRNQGNREQRPNMYMRTPYMEQAPTTVLPKQHGNKNKNKVYKATILPLNLWNVFDDDNEGSEDIMFMGGQFTVWNRPTSGLVVREHGAINRSRPENA